MYFRPAAREVVAPINLRIAPFFERAGRVVPVRVAKAVVAVQIAGRVLRPIVERAAGERTSPVARVQIPIVYELQKCVGGGFPRLPLKRNSLSLERAGRVVPVRVAKADAAEQTAGRA